MITQSLKYYCRERTETRLSAAKSKNSSIDIHCMSIPGKCLIVSPIVFPDGIFGSHEIEFSNVTITDISTLSKCSQETTFFRKRYFVSVETAKNQKGFYKKSHFFSKQFYFLSVCFLVERFSSKILRCVCFCKVS